MNIESVGKNIISFFDFRKKPDPDTKIVDRLLTEIESHIFPADNPTVPRSRRTIRRKFKKLMEIIGSKGEDWEGLA